MLIRQAFQTFLQLQSEADRGSAEADSRPPAAIRAWPMDHTPTTEARDWTLDWRWFASEADL
jgi:hypothetical protein